MIKITQAQTEQFLQEKYGTGVSDVEALGEGGWSHAFRFVHDGTKNVIRWSDVVDNFERDAFAASFNRDGLPIPKITEIGKGHDKFFAISHFVSGKYLESLSANELENTLPAILTMLRAIRTVDVSSTKGFGFWNKEGNGSAASWREFLLDDKNESEGSLIQGWKTNLEKSSLGFSIYNQLWEKFEPLVKLCPEERKLVHSDLINANVLTADGKITAVIDWGSSFYGDSLFDIAWFTFYEPWFQNFQDIGLPQQLFEDYKADPNTNKENLEQRLLCYHLRIGIGSIAYNAFKQNWNYAQEAAEYTMKITSIL